jgi:hypothetical protein
VVGGVVVEAEGFEDGLGAWSVPGAPAGSPPNAGDWATSQGIGLETVIAAVATDDTLMFGFGLEQLETDEARNAVVGAVLDHFAGG